MNVRYSALSSKESMGDGKFVSYENLVQPTLLQKSKVAFSHTRPEVK